MKVPDVLVVDDDPGILDFLKNLLDKEGIKGEYFVRGGDLLEFLENHDAGLILVDIHLPDMDGIELLKKLRDRYPVILFTAYGTIEEAVGAIKEGALDYIEKPIEPVIFIQKIKNYLKLSRREVPPDIVLGRSQAMREVWKRVEKLAQVDVPVLIVGETGTGKEVMAREIHRRSKRKNRKFLPVHCAVIPENLFESELFGYKKGAFSGATQNKEGLVKIADGGTLFLDEVGDIPLALQVKLLRFIETHTFIPIGGKEEERVDVRIIAATNKNLEEAVEKGEMREDLYFRIKRFTIEIPPLRERKEDIPLFVEYFIQLYSREFNKNIRGVEKDAMEKITSYHWPGNVRELSSVIQEAVLYADEVIKAEDVKVGGEKMNLRKEMMEMEKEKVIEALRSSGGNVTKAAELLGVQRRQIYRIAKRYGIDIESFR